MEIDRLGPDRSWLAFDWLIEDSQLFLCGVRVPAGVGRTTERLLRSLNTVNGLVPASWFSGTIQSISNKKRDPRVWRGFDFDIVDGHVVDYAEVEGCTGPDKTMLSIVRNIR